MTAGRQATGRGARPRWRGGTRPAATRCWPATGARREGELDLVVAGRAAVVFCEVKSRRGAAFGDAGRGRHPGQAGSPATAGRASGWRRDGRSWPSSALRRGQRGPRPGGRGDRSRVLIEAGGPGTRPGPAGPVPVPAEVGRGPGHDHQVPGAGARCPGGSRGRRSASWPRTGWTRPDLDVLEVGREPAHPSSAQSTRATATTRPDGHEHVVRPAAPRPCGTG